MLFDHAAILINLPHSGARMGFAWACPPIVLRGEQQIGINVSKWMQRPCRDEWARLLEDCLEEEDGDTPLPKPGPVSGVKNGRNIGRGNNQTIGPQIFQPTR